MRPTVLALLALLPLAALLPTPAHAASYTVLIGWETLVDQYGPAWYSLFFYPQDLVIAYGDSVTWVWNSGEIHNVVFTNGTLQSETAPDGKSLTAIAGQVGNQTHFVDPTATYSSGLGNNNLSPATLTFIPETGSGTFPYYCSIHASSGMVASITVLPAGQTPPLTPEAINATVDSLVAGLEAFAQQEIAAIEAAAPKTGAEVKHVTLADGSQQWSVIGGAMWMNGNESMYARFLPAYIEVNVGDTITWTVDGMDPHIVYFQQDNIWPLIYTNWTHSQTYPVNPAWNAPEPTYPLVPTFGANGAPLTSLPTAMWPNAQGSVYSGLIFAEALAPFVPFPSNYSVMFMEAGSFLYQCAIHLDIGMIAQVVVKPAGAPLCTDPNNDATCAAVTTTPISVLGDPQFVGLRGQSYQVHGIDGEVYALISEQRAQVNARFAFLDGPRPCPTIMQQWSEGEKAAPISCWSHAGSYLSELALFTPSARLFVKAGAAAAGFAAVEFNATTQGAGTVDLSYEQLSSHHLTVTLGSYTLSIDNSDGFVNIARVLPLLPLSQLASHGLLGQTHTRRQGSGMAAVVEGGVDDYVVAGGLWAADAMYSKYEVASE